MSNPNGVVYLLDDEPGMVKAVTRLLRVNGFEVRGFTTPASFLEAFRPGSDSCVILDVAMPGLDGLHLQRRLTHEGILLPIVFLTGHGDIPMSVRAMKAGAVDFLTKPVKEIHGSRLHRPDAQDRKSTRLNSSHRTISYAVFCLKKKKKKEKH